MFTVTDKQKKQAVTWFEEHACTLPKNQRVLTWCFTPIGIGSTLLIKCVCGRHSDITDVSTW